jgi:hypothetical protein
MNTAMTEALTLLHGHEMRRLLKLTYFSVPPLDVDDPIVQDELARCSLVTQDELEHELSKLDALDRQVALDIHEEGGHDE